MTTSGVRYNAYSEHLRERYGEKVYKLPVSLPVTCPNRDGQCGHNGCVFCGEIGAGYENLPASLTVSDQLAANKAHIAPKYKAKKFIPYFQNFSNTYLPVEQLKHHVIEACKEDIVAIALATRPDCINDNYLEMLAAIKDEYGVDICIELGLQTVNYHTLEKINRGHTLAEFIDATRRIKHWSMDVCTHLIVNLPWDGMADVIESAKIVSALEVDQVKLHALYIVKNTVMADWYQKGEITLISKEEYVERVVTFLEYLHPDIVIQRLIGRAPETNTLFTNWQTGWWKIREAIEGQLVERDTWQGKKCSYLNGSAVKKFVR
ncbi:MULTISPECIES: TIGR01212 family radical SAM protein [Sporomusa]|jgi:radical SAM protein (TIGR01212 family)|uniref:TIGR01212 family radical SAM protein n=1 Tax=Sporomusa TaxID=2375 RepID=UPI00166B50B8|nr:MULTISPECIES: TIGR01212 family radical SAM protein [Sporomusa]HML34642.1 TIGR01212 family radical SAM protein [Sporomusa sphaeroides]